MLAEALTMLPRPRGRPVEKGEPEEGTVTWKEEKGKAEIRKKNFA